jgi:tetratricopeptide (TPR) repeat protein
MNAPEDQNKLAAEVEVGATSAETDPFVGTVYGDRYEILRRAGEGGFGVIYQARDRVLNRLVGIKALEGRATFDEYRMRRFHREALAASAIQHENVMMVYDFGCLPDGRPCIVMEWLDGEPLADLLSAGRRLNPNQAIEIFADLASGLSAAHAQGIIHRDLSTSNIILTKNRSGKVGAKILDFGLAKLFDREGVDLSTLTGPYELLGTVTYMSPEQCSGREVDARTDIYALSCVLYEAISGRAAFAAPTVHECVMKHLEGNPLPLSEVAPEAKVSVELSTVIFRAMESDREKRFQTMSEFESALRNLSPGRVAGPTLTNKAESAASLSNMRQPLLLAAVVAVLGAVVTGIVMLNAHRAPRVSVPPKESIGYVPPRQVVVQPVHKPQPASAQLLMKAHLTLLRARHHWYYFDDTVTAESLARSVLAMLSHCSPSNEDASAHKLLCALYMSQKDLKKAEPEARQAIYMYETVGNYEALSQAHYTLGQILEDSDRRPEAIEEYRQSIAANDKAGRPWSYFRLNSLLALGTNYGRLGNSKDMERAFHQLFAENSEIGTFDDYTATKLAVARKYIAQNDLNAGKFAAAKSTLRDGFPAVLRMTQTPDDSALIKSRVVFHEMSDSEARRFAAEYVSLLEQCSSQLGQTSEAKQYAIDKRKWEQQAKDIERKQQQAEHIYHPGEPQPAHLKPIMWQPTLTNDLSQLLAGAQAARGNWPRSVSFGRAAVAALNQRHTLTQAIDAHLQLAQGLFWLGHLDESNRESLAGIKLFDDAKRKMDVGSIDAARRKASDCYDTLVGSLNADDRDDEAISKAKLWRKEVEAMPDASERTLLRGHVLWAMLLCYAHMRDYQSFRTYFAELCKDRDALCKMDPGFKTIFDCGYGSMGAYYLVEHKYKEVEPWEDKALNWFGGRGAPDLRSGAEGALITALICQGRISEAREWAADWHQMNGARLSTLWFDWNDF